MTEQEKAKRHQLLEVVDSELGELARIQARSGWERKAVYATVVVLSGYYIDTFDVSQAFVRLVALMMTIWSILEVVDRHLARPSQRGPYFHKFNTYLFSDARYSLVVETLKNSFLVLAVIYVEELGSWKVIPFLAAKVFFQLTIFSIFFLSYFKINLAQFGSIAHESSRLQGAVISIIFFLFKLYVVWLFLDFSLVDVTHAQIKSAFCVAAIFELVPELIWSSRDRLRVSLLKKLRLDLALAPDVDLVEAQLRLDLLCREENLRIEVLIETLDELRSQYQEIEGLIVHNRYKRQELGMLIRAGKTAGWEFQWKFFLFENSISKLNKKTGKTDSVLGDYERQFDGLYVLSSAERKVVYSSFKRARNAWSETRNRLLNEMTGSKELLSQIRKLLKSENPHAEGAATSTANVSNR